MHESGEAPDYDTQCEEMHTMDDVGYKLWDAIGLMTTGSRDIRMKGCSNSSGGCIT